MKKKQRKQHRKQLKKKDNSYKNKPAHENEEFKDTIKINQALNDQDYALLREIGCGTGFISHPIRRRVWPVLLHVTDPEKDNTIEGSLEDRHKDEDQVNLDVKRSFNSYPKNISLEDKEKLEGQLKRVITHVLRSYPSLHYYQGFHDICSVFILLFGEKYACRLMERIALFYVRDNMTDTLEPVMKQLTILDTLIRLEDVTLYDFITEASVLPYYCLSWVITWCSHDLDDLEQIARLFDFFISSNPFMVIYFSAAVVLSQRDNVLELPCDTSTIHSFLTKLLITVDLDVEGLIGKAQELFDRYSVFNLQCESTIALDEVSAINRYEKDWEPIVSQEDLNGVLEDQIIPILTDKTEKRPIELTSTKSVSKSRGILPSILLQKISKIDRQDMTVYALMTIGAGVGLVAVLMSNNDFVREWLVAGSRI